MAKSTMTPDEQKVYEQYQEMFNHPAWKKHMESIENFKSEMTKNVPYKIDNELKLGEVRGAVQAFDMILNLQATMEGNAEQEEYEDD